MQQQTDLLTGEAFKPLRRNQKFASPRNRIAFHNQKAMAERDAKAFIDKPLQKNHRILIELIKPQETKVIAKDFLLGKGYDMMVMSHYEKFDEKMCPALYNFIFTEILSDKPTITIYRSK